MKYKHTEVAVTESVGTIWLNRPDKHNALSDDMWTDIPRAMAELDSNPAVRVVIVAGRGKSFTVGIDVAMLANLAPTGPSQATANKNLYDTIRRLQKTASVFSESPKPVIAAIHGYCLGAGMDLITACDIRIAAKNSVFSIRETRMALVADVGTLQRLPAIVGAGHVAELAYTGRDIDSSRALEIGLINSVHTDAETAQKAAHELGAEIAANSPLVIEGIKRVLGANDGRTVPEALDFVAQWNATYLLSNDLVEATNAYFEKRPPEFKGD